MAKKIKLPLDMGNDVKVRTIEELKENYNAEKVVSYFLDGQLLTWLEERFYEEEAEKIKKISKDSPNISAEIAKAFEIEIQDEVDVEEIEERNERLNLLRQFTSDDEILKNVDLVAFSQEDMDIVHTSDIIYLCGDSFRIPYSVEGKTYIGVNSPTVDIKSDDKIDLKSKNITVKNCVFSEATLANMKSEESVVEKSSSSDLSKKFGALESEIISSNIEVKKGKTLRFENKEIFVRADIECSGKIEFENCVIHYNEEDGTGINIIDGIPQIHIKGCRVICHGCFSNAFITFDYSDEIERCSIKVYDTEFVEAYLLNCNGDQTIDLDVMMNIEIEKCIIYNPVFFMYLGENIEYADININNCLIVQKDCSEALKEYIDENDLEDAMFESKYELETFSGDIRVNNTTFIGSKEDRNQIIFKLFDATITNSVFYNAYACLFGATHIENCIFNNCNPSISLFDLGEGLETRVWDCQFVDCKNQIIWGFNTAVFINDCDFINLRNDTGEDYILVGLESRIWNCKFNGIDCSEGGLLITYAGVPDKEKRLSPIEVKNCCFENCATVSGNGNLNEFISSEKIRSGARKKVLAIDICDCEGLENLDEEGDTAENYTIRYEDIGCDMDIDSIMADFS